MRKKSAKAKRSTRLEIKLASELQAMKQERDFWHQRFMDTTTPKPFGLFRYRLPKRLELEDIGG